MKDILRRIADRLLSCAWVGLACCAFSACLVNPSDRCGSHQVQQGDLCACETGFGLVGTHCVACAEHEVGSLTGCACAPGFGRADASQPCAAVETLGKACAQSADCTDATFNYCEPEGESGYCTRPDCTSSADCINDYSCNSRGVRHFCQRPPTGFGKSCQNDGDCSAFEASYCESLSSNVCLKSGCKADPSVCPGDWACCDIALLGNSLCLPQDQLESGACPAGGHLITGSN